MTEFAYSRNEKKTLFGITIFQNTVKTLQALLNVCNIGVGNIIRYRFVIFINQISNMTKSTFLYITTCQSRGIFKVFCKLARHVFYRLHSFVNRFGKCRIPANGGRHRNFQHKHRKSAFIQFVNCTGGQISATADDDQIFHQGLMICAAFSIRSTISYMLVTPPTPSFSFRP